MVPIDGKFRQGHQRLLRRALGKRRYFGHRLRDVPLRFLTGIGNGAGAMKPRRQQSTMIARLGEFGQNLVALGERIKGDRRIQ